MNLESNCKKCLVQSVQICIAMLCACLFLSSAIAYACPSVGRLIDYNCDQKLKITFVGDSIVSGYGDIAVRKHGGYTVRLKQKVPEARIYSLGYPGISTGRLLRVLEKDINNKKSEVYKKLNNSDIIIIDVGRNDYWLKEPVNFSVRNIQRIVDLFNKNLVRKKVRPYIVVSKLVRTGRSWQQPFVDSLNAQLQFLKATTGFPLHLDFTRVKADISGDGIHPNPLGYKKMTRLAAKWLIKKSPTLMLKKRSDRDGDGIFDLFEDGNKFFTSSKLYDTDYDSFGDGEEIFNLGSDPLNQDDPVPSPTATPEPEVTPTPEAE